ncbi:MAG: hypothetical protein ACPG7F_16760 [Aggregatilineales bacterium]
MEKWDFELNKTINAARLDEDIRAALPDVYMNFKATPETLTVRVEDSAAQADRDTLQVIIDAHDHTVESQGRQNQAAKRAAKEATRKALEKPDAVANATRMGVLNTDLGGVLDAATAEGLTTNQMKTKVAELAKRIERIERLLEDVL